MQLNLNFGDWHPVIGFEDRYEVSRYGSIRNFRSGKEVKGCPNSKGYLNVTLYFDGGRESHHIHRLVAKAFLSNPDSMAFMNHDDLNKTNNLWSNLEWMTPKGNSQHASQNEAMPRGEINGTSKLTADEVLSIRQHLTTGCTKTSIAEIYGVSRKLILDIQNKKVWKHV
jgi:hypothetical protein